MFTLAGGHTLPQLPVFCVGGQNVWEPSILSPRWSWHVEQSEISPIFAMATRSRNDQRFFAPLRMTSLQQLQLSTALLHTTTELPNAAH